jgi:hypothetical protein
LTDTLINNEWRLGRIRRVEAEIWEHAAKAYLTKNLEAPACSSGDPSGQFERLQHLQVARAHGLLTPQTRTSKTTSTSNPQPPPAGSPAAQPEPAANRKPKPEGA